MALTFQEMMGSPLDSDPPLFDEAARGQHPLERMKRLRSLLPNLRVCQVVGNKVCLRCCDPFGLDETGAAELMQLGLRSIIDLRSDHERTEPGNAPLYSYARVLRWQPDIAGFGFVAESPGVEDIGEEVSTSATVYRIDCLRSPQSQLRRFLANCESGGEVDGECGSPPSRLSVSDVSAYLLPASADRPAKQLLRDVIDCFPSAMAAVFRVLAGRNSHPALLVSRDGQRSAAVVSCLMQLLMGEDPSIVADMHAASETEYGLWQGLFPPEEQNAKLKECRLTMLEFIDYIMENHRSAENYLLRAGLTQQEIRLLKTV